VTRGEAVADPLGHRPGAGAREGGVLDRPAAEEYDTCAGVFPERKDVLMESSSALHFPAGEGSAERWWISGSRIAIKLTAEQTQGHAGMWEWDAPRGAATPLHVHRREDEEFVVLEGTARFVVDDRRIDAVAGDVVFLPLGVPHAYVITSERARVLGMVTPGGHERFFVEVGAPADGPRAEPDRAAMAAVGSRLGVEILGPPPALG
jgi:quercetin dioxygenase-like cupin family protein